MTSLVSFVIGHQVRDDWLRAELANGLEDGQGHRFDLQLHAEQLVGEVVGVEHKIEQPLMETF